MFKTPYKLSFFCKNCLGLLNRITKKIIFAGIYLFTLTLVIISGYYAVLNKFELTPIFLVVDEYLKLIFTSWPAAIIIIGIFLMISQRDAIDEYIRKRFKSAGWVDSYAYPQQNQDEVVETNSLEEVGSATTGSESEKFKELYLFERGYNSIFGSQIKLLEWLYILGSKGLSFEEINSYFNTVKQKSWVGLVDQWSTDKYLQFLITSNFIEVSSGEDSYYRITDFGKKFIDYLNSAKYNKDKVL